MSRCQGFPIEILAWGSGSVSKRRHINLDLFFTDVSIFSLLFPLESNLASSFPHGDNLSRLVALSPHIMGNVFTLYTSLARGPVK